jgi:hypothetical protein
MKLPLICALGMACLAPGPSAQGQPRHDAPWLDSLKPFILYVLENIERTTPKELVVQKRQRNTFQREGYARVLRDLVSGDAAMALVSYIKMTLHIELTMEHKSFWIVRPDPARGIQGFPFPDDWSLPADPWKREWWSLR